MWNSRGLSFAGDNKPAVRLGIQTRLNHVQAGFGNRALDVRKGHHVDVRREADHAHKADRDGPQPGLLGQTHRFRDQHTARLQ